MSCDGSIQILIPILILIIVLILITINPGEGLCPEHVCLSLSLSLSRSLCVHVLKVRVGRERIYVFVECTYGWLRLQVCVIQVCLQSKSFVFCCPFSLLTLSASLSLFLLFQFHLNVILFIDMTKTCWHSQSRQTIATV